MKKLILLMVIGGFSLTISSCIDGPTTDEMERYWDSCGGVCGERIVLDGDTLTILTYDLWSDKFTLSNGQKISPIAVKKLKN